MKQLVFLLLLLSILLPASLMARDLDNNFLFTLYGGGGVTWPVGDFNRNYETEAAADWCAAGGIAAAWAPVSFGAVALGVQYSFRRLSVDMVYNGEDITETMSTHYFDLSLGWKGIVSVLYYEAGFVCGIPFGSWENTAARDGDEITPVLGPDGEVDEEYRHIEYGAYFGLGVIFWVTENLAVEGGARLQVSFTESYQNEEAPQENTLKSRAVFFTAGVTYCL